MEITFRFQNTWGYRTEIDCPKAFVFPQNFFQTGSQNMFSFHHNFKRESHIAFLKEKKNNDG